MKYKNYKKKYEPGGIIPSQDASTSDAMSQFAALAAVEKGVYDTTYNIGTEFLSKNYDQDQFDVLTQGSSKFKNIPFVGKKIGAVADTWNLISGKTKSRLADLDKAKMNEFQDDYMNSYFNNFAPTMNTKLSFAEGGPLDFGEDDIKYNRSLKIKRNLFNKIVTTDKYTDEDGSQWKVKSKYNPKTKKNIEKYWVNGKFNGKLTNDTEPLYIPNSVQGDFNNQPKMQYAHGGNMKKHGVVQIPESVGLHDENPQGGAIIGDASLEEQEILQYQNGLPSYVIPDQVNGKESIKMPMMDKDYNVITDTDGNPKFSKKSPAQWLKHKLATRNKLREDIDSYAKPAVDQVNQIAQDATELNHLMNDISSTVQADNIAAYGGKINTKKYPGLNSPKKYYKGGGWTYDDYKPKPILGPVNPEYDPSEYAKEQRGKLPESKEPTIKGEFEPIPIPNEPKSSDAWYEEPGYVDIARFAPVVTNAAEAVFSFNNLAKRKLPRQKIQASKVDYTPERIINTEEMRRGVNKGINQIRNTGSSAGMVAGNTKDLILNANKQLASNISKSVMNESNTNAQLEQQARSQQFTSDNALIRDNESMYQNAMEQGWAAVHDSVAAGQSGVKSKENRKLQEWLAKYRLNTRNKYIDKQGNTWHYDQVTGEYYNPITQETKDNLNS